MAWLQQRKLTEREARATRETVARIGLWLRAHEPARSVEEDLLGHKLRTLLVAASDAVAVGNRAAMRQVLEHCNGCVVRLSYARAERGVR